MDSSSRSDTRRRLGVLTHGSLSAGVEMKHAPGESVEAVRTGRFCVVEGAHYDFFALVTDVKIEAANEGILLHPPGEEDELLRQVMQGSGTYATVSLKPMLMLEQGLSDADPLPVKTVPAHFSVVGEANEDDVARVFGHESRDGGDRFFHVGTPLEMDTPVCLDLARLVERSNAVFGKTGTGKSFLTRLLLCGTVKTGRAVNLVFDMHNEYGFQARKENADGRSTTVPGLRDLFPGKVQVYSLDPASARRRGKSPDVEVHLWADQVEPEDILPLRETLNLNPTAAESTYGLKKVYGDDWLARLLRADGPEVEEMAERTGTHPGSLSALKRKLDRLDGLPFFHLDRTAEHRDVVESLLESIAAGKSVVLEFGQHNSLLVYLLVANVITRRLRRRYEKLYEEHEADPDHVAPPRQLMITIEEAHKFLGPATAKETPFGKIAREMRKFSVSLLIVDQRPSGIDEEVLSQIGTKIVAQLSDEKDIAAALVGTSGASALRQVLASLDSKQQALVLGHAVPMPVVIQSRLYDDAFFADLKGDAPSGTASEMQEQMSGLF
ncbi:MAG: ATP-binding protein [Bacteroidota bacterium]